MLKNLNLNQNVIANKVKQSIIRHPEFSSESHEILNRATLVQNDAMTESGRSMVEMLGVLAVMGVLSVGGVAMYTNAMNKHKANELLNEASKRAVVVSTRALSGQTSIPLTEFSGHSSVAGGTFADEEAVDVSGNTFAIKIKSVDSAVCTQMKNSIGSNTVVRGIPENCGTEVISLVFNKDLSVGNVTKTPAEICEEDSDKVFCSGACYDRLDAYRVNSITKGANGECVCSNNGTFVSGRCVNVVGEPGQPLDLSEENCKAGGHMWMENAHCCAESCAVACPEGETCVYMVSSGADCWGNQHLAPDGGLGRLPSPMNRLCGTCDEIEAVGMLRFTSKSECYACPNTFYYGGSCFSCDNEDIFINEMLPDGSPDLAEECEKRCPNRVGFWEMDSGDGFPLCLRKEDFDMEEDCSFSYRYQGHLFCGYLENIEDDPTYLDYYKNYMREVMGLNYCVAPREQDIVGIHYSESTSCDKTFEDCFNHGICFKD